MIGSSENRISYNGNGIATEFAYTFKILEKSDMKVLHVAADGTETLLVSDYYVDMEKSVVLYPGYAPGAEIPEQNRPPILPVGERLVLYREVPITQESALDKHWPFNVIENGLDKLTIICQQIWDRLQRSFYVSESTSTNFDPKVPIEAGKTFRVKDDGTGFEVTEDPGKVIDGATLLLKQTTEQAESANEAATNAQNAATHAEMQADSVKKYKALWFDSVAAMKAEPSLTAGAYVNTGGYYATNDGGGASYLIRTKAGTDTDDGGSLHQLANGLVAELIVENGTVCPEQFGARGDGVEHIVDSVDLEAKAIQAALNTKKLVLIAKSYKISTSIIFPTNTHCIFDGSINYIGNNSAMILSGLNITIVGKGIAISNGTSLISNDQNQDVANCYVRFFRGYCHGADNSVIYLHSNKASACVVSNKFEGIILSDINSESKCDAVRIENSNDGYVNENIFDRLVPRTINNAIKIVNNSPTRGVDGNKFLCLEAEDADVQIDAIANKGIIANKFDLRSNELWGKSNIIKINGLFDHNIISVNDGIEPQAFLIQNGKYPKTANYLPANKLVGDLVMGGAAVSTDALFGCCDNNIIFKHYNVDGNSSPYLKEEPYLFDYINLGGFPNKYCYEIGSLKDTEISIVTLDLNGKFAFACNFPFRIHLGYTTNGKAKFTLKDGDTIYINEKEIDTNAFYEIYINVDSAPAIRKI